VVTEPALLDTELPFVAEDEGWVGMLGRHMNPIAAVRMAARRAEQAEAIFQVALVEAIDLSKETPERRALARSWLRQLRALAE
jgi:hypothetical protein